MKRTGKHINLLIKTKTLSCERKNARRKLKFYDAAANSVAVHIWENLLHALEEIVFLVLNKFENN